MNRASDSTPTDIPAPGVVIGQRVRAEQVTRARQLRRGMTPAEQILWQGLRGGRLCGLHFRRQQVIDGFYVDFYCHAAGVVVEVDGGVHRQQMAYDEERDLRLSARGLRIIRFQNEEVATDLASVLARIAVACQVP